MQFPPGEHLAALLCSLSVCRVVSCHVVSCRVVSCRVVSCRVVSCRVVSCLVSSRLVSSRSFMIRLLLPFVLQYPYPDKHVGNDGLDIPPGPSVCTMQRYI